MSDKIHYSKPSIYDSKAIFELIKNSPPLDVNSEYLYMLMCHHFTDMCVVAKHDSKVIGVITAFMPPNKKNTLFVWQVGVAKDFRGRGIAPKMLEEIVQRPECDHIRFIEATITPDNTSSKSFLSYFANKLNASYNIAPLFTKDHFTNSHEEENLLRIGPIKISKLMEVKAL